MFTMCECRCPRLIVSVAIRGQHLEANSLLSLCGGSMLQAGRTASIWPALLSHLSIMLQEGCSYRCMPQQPAFGIQSRDQPRSPVRSKHLYSQIHLSSLTCCIFLKYTYWCPFALLLFLFITSSTPISNLYSEALILL